MSPARKAKFRKWMKNNKFPSFAIVLRDIKNMSVRELSQSYEGLEELFIEWGVVVEKEDYAQGGSASFIVRQSKTKF